MGRNRPLYATAGSACGHLRTLRGRVAGRFSDAGWPRASLVRAFLPACRRAAQLARGSRAGQAFARETRGQSTVEYALVLLAFLAMVLALGAVWAAAREGGLQRLARLAASHAIEGEGVLGGMRDIVLF